MIQAISANTPISFKGTSVTKSNSQKIKDENPISRKGEAMKLATATFLGGLALAGKLLFELARNGDFIFEILANKADKMAKENCKQSIISSAKKEALKNKRVLYFIGAFAALTATFLAGFALLYTAFRVPQIAYESKVNTFKKSKDMDVYIKSNKAEKELYTQLDEKAKSSNSQEKAKLKEQYLKLKNAKNQVPDFVNLKLKS